MEPIGSKTAASSNVSELRIGCVSFLNAKPLIDGLEDHQADAPGAPGSPKLSVKYDVPSRLLDDLVAGDADVALCPVIDLQMSPTPLDLIPAGGIGCDGKTLTVRLFSRVPFEQVETVYTDTDSHTSVVLMTILFVERFGIRPKVIPYHAREHVAEHRLAVDPETVLLIGDKVVTDMPDEAVYPHTLDLGELWKQVTGLPFVFAVWMAKPGADLGPLPATLKAVRENNQERIDQIVDEHAESHGWTKNLAQRYLGEWLKYSIDEPQIEGIRHFCLKAHELELIDHKRPITVRAI